MARSAGSFKRLPIDSNFLCDLVSKRQNREKRVSLEVFEKLSSDVFNFNLPWLDRTRFQASSWSLRSLVRPAHGYIERMKLLPEIVS